VVEASNSVLTFMSNAVEAFHITFPIDVWSLQRVTKELQSTLGFPDTRLLWSVVCVGLSTTDILGFIFGFEIKVRGDCALVTFKKS
jgi:hypothetical protein